MGRPAQGIVTLESLPPSLQSDNDEVRELKAGSPEDKAYDAVVMSAPTTAHVKNVCEAGYRELVDSAADSKF